MRIVNNWGKERKDGDDNPKQTDVDAEGVRWMIRGGRVLNFIKKEENSALMKELLRMSLVEVNRGDCDEEGKGGGVWADADSEASEGGWSVDDVHIRFHEGVVIEIDAPTGGGLKELILISYRPVLLRSEVRGVASRYWANKKSEAERAKLDSDKALADEKASLENTKADDAEGREEEPSEREETEKKGGCSLS